MSDYDEQREARRQEQRQYEADVFYEVWRNGGNPDRIDDYRVNQNYWDGADAESAARMELRRQMPRPEEASEEEN